MARRKSNGAPRAGATGAGDVTIDLTDRGLTAPAVVRRGVAVAKQVAAYADTLGLEQGTRRGEVLFAVACAIAEQLPSDERPDWFDTDAEILDGLT